MPRPEAFAMTMRKAKLMDPMFELPWVLVILTAAGIWAGIESVRCRQVPKAKIVAYIRAIIALFFALAFQSLSVEALTDAGVGTLWKIGITLLLVMVCYLGGCGIAEKVYADPDSGPDAGPEPEEAV